MIESRFVSPVTEADIAAFDVARSAITAIIRESRNPLRRTFRDRSRLEQSLGEVLDLDERAWLARFLDGDS